MKVCMFVKNTFQYDARVSREALTLVGAGHEVTVIAIHDRTTTEAHEVRDDGIEVFRVPRTRLGVEITNDSRRRIKEHIWARNEYFAHGGPNGTPIEKTTRDKLVTIGLKVARFAVKKGWKLARRAVRVQKGRASQTAAINRRMIARGLETGADVFHSHDLNTLFVGRICKERTPGSKLVYDSHELQTERSRMGGNWRRWATWNERQGLPAADALIVASPSWIEFNRQLHGEVPALTATVLNTPVHRTVEPRDLRGELGIPDDVPILLYQGSIQENRGIEPAIEATMLLDDAVLVVVGYGYHRPALERMVAERGIGDRVKFFGPIPHEELLAWTAAADIGLANIISASHSYHTSLPNKLFEYMMAGIAVIGSDSPEIGRVIRETGVGEVARADDPESIAAAAKKILTDPTPYIEATIPAANKYQWSVDAQKLLNLYQSLR
ncbi:MAG: glycosyltransferase [Acidimicrobiia bacterium]|nr:glycosyltransferase [Acidimicrobiia bacterium]